MSDELAAISDAVHSFPQDVGDSALAGAKHRLATERAFYARQIDLNRAALDTIASAISFLINDAGTYELAADSRMLFASDALA